jgi:hypothetical protein
MPYRPIHPQPMARPQRTLPTCVCSRVARAYVRPGRTCGHGDGLAGELPSRLGGAAVGAAGHRRRRRRGRRTQTFNVTLQSPSVTRFVRWEAWIVDCCCSLNWFLQ